jgi:very-short-patch-repair endonuclease
MPYSEQIKSLEKSKARLKGGFNLTVEEIRQLKNFSQAEKKALTEVAKTIKNLDKEIVLLKKLQRKEQNKAGRKQKKEAKKDRLEQVKTAHNEYMNHWAERFVWENIIHMTDAEREFTRLTESKGLKLRFQYQINILGDRGRKQGRILKFYIADFCDTKNMIIFEIDGGYHTTKEQKLKDFHRTKDLNRLGYRVIRLTNEEIFNGVAEETLYAAYSNLK